MESYLYLCCPSLPLKIISALFTFCITNTVILIETQFMQHVVSTEATYLVKLNRLCKTETEDRDRSYSSQTEAVYNTIYQQLMNHPTTIKYKIKYIKKNTHLRLIILQLTVFNHSKHDHHVMHVSHLKVKKHSQSHLIHSVDSLI